MDLQVKEDVLDPATFPRPRLEQETPRVIIEFCSRCRWQHRASWVQTELFATFPPPAIASISLVPRAAEETAGRWRVWVAKHGDDEEQLVWDRKIEGGFGEMKELKQRIRDLIQPQLNLGHSDKKEEEKS